MFPMTDLRHRVARHARPQLISARTAVAAGVLFCASAILAQPAFAQGEYVNFEPGQVSPISVGKLTFGALERRVLFVCNTPDDCVELYDAEAPFAFMQRVHTGLSPVTTRFNESQQTLYTCNFLGDSVTKITFSNQNVGGTLQTTALVDRTVFVGNEPSDIAFIPGSNDAVVSLHGASGFAVLNATTLAVTTPFELANVADGVLPNRDAVVKHPTQLAAVGSERLYMLDRHDDDDNLHTGTLNFDFDLLVMDGTATSSSPLATTADRFMGGGLGTTMHSFAINAAGTKMFVVGMVARQNDASGEANVAALSTGFVQSWMHVIELAPGVAPVTNGDRPSGETDFPSINLNRDYAAGGEVLPADAFAQPTGIALIEGSGGVEQIVITSLSSDKVMFLWHDPTKASGYNIQQSSFSAFNPGPGAPGSSGESGYGMAGLYGLTYDPNPADPNAAGSNGLLYATCAFDNSVLVISPVTRTTVARFQLHNDPTPNIARTGRKFLFSASFSGNGMVSCSSCHILGGTDAIAWDLGGMDNPAVAIHPWLKDDTVNSPLVGTVGTEFPDFKGRMVTQTLRGLVNSQVTGFMQAVFSNAPYHWRADRDNFSDFNQAFVGLQGMPPLTAPPALPAGLTAGEMNQYTVYINSLHHEPNPLQAKNRRPRPLDPVTGFDEQRGLELFHTESTVDARSCVQCHSHPEGSNNRMTETFILNGINHPLETAALRSLGDRGVLYRDSAAYNDPSQRLFLTQTTGLTHGGLTGVIANPPFPDVQQSRSLNDFISFFALQTPGTQTQQEDAIEDITAFVRAYDAGVAPVIGCSFTLTGNFATDLAATADMREQVREANAGLVLYLRRGSIESGWWLDLQAGTDRFRKEGTTTTQSLFQFSRVAANSTYRVILQSVPLGSERRVAAMGNDPAVITGTTVPANIELSAMAPATQWEDISQFTTNWVLAPNDTSPSVGAIQDLAAAVLADQASGAGQFGLAGQQHEPPRRFRVTGDNIRSGATLALAFSATNPNAVLLLPIYPTEHTEVSENGVTRTIWESTIEADDLQTMAFLCGSVFTPGVLDVIRFTPPSQALSPSTFNLPNVLVINEDGSSSAPVAQPLTVRYDR